MFTFDGSETTEPENAHFNLFPRYCSCPEGQAEQQADYKQSLYDDWIAEARQIIKSLELGKRKTYRFSTWEKERQSPNSLDVFNTVEKYTNHVTTKQTKKWLWLTGSYGLGKTHLGVAALRKIGADMLKSILMVPWPEYCTAIQESWNEDKGDKPSFAAMKRAGVLLLDDIDKSTATTWAIQKLYEVIDYRSDREKITIITANHTIEQLRFEWNQISSIRDKAAAALSRIDGQLYAQVVFTGKDQRQNVPSYRAMR